MKIICFICTLLDTLLRREKNFTSASSEIRMYIVQMIALFKILFDCCDTMSKESDLSSYSRREEGSCGVRFFNMSASTHATTVCDNHEFIIK